ncbi:ABC1 kinase family protein [Roseinatronobacter sp. NSM]|uniref:ABC1 kinase family protein n=1 Tax=Roseinatronobacter sp. NSM TaxID=3457785 RepID=UPI004035BB00
MTQKPVTPQGASVPTSRTSRLLHLGGITAGIAGGVVASGVSQLARGKRPALPDLVLSPANMGRLTSGLSHMRGAALKLGQMLSMDAGAVLSPQLSDILATLRDDARHMPPKQLQTVLNAEWGAGWRGRFRHFDVRPFAAASIGQVHRARTLDGRDIAIKVQYPGIQASIDSDVNNIAALLRMTGLVPKGMDIAPLLDSAKRQLHAEADYTAEAANLRRFGDLLAQSDGFVLPQVQPELSTARVLAMSYIESDPVEALAHAPQHIRDRAAMHLVDLVARELFVFGAMQTDPNFANFRVQAATGRIVLLDFGAVQDIPPQLASGFRVLLNAALDGGQDRIRRAMLDIGYFGAATSPHHQDLIQRMFETAVAPLRQDTPYDFGTSDLLERLRDMGLAIGTDRDLMHVPPASTLFLHRKIGGIYLLAARLRARVNLRHLVERYR